MAGSQTAQIKVTALAEMPNREALLARLTQAVAQAERHGEKLALVVLDLNRSTMTRAALEAPDGVELAAMVADDVKFFTRASDTVAFLGLDLFGIVMERVRSVDQILGLTQRLLRVFDGHWHIAGRDIHLTPAIGVAVYPESGRQAEPLLTQAVGAAHDAARKSIHRPLLADAALQSTLERRLGLERDLRRAVEQQELALHYQPQVETASGKLTGFEALVRWPHPEMGLVLPDEFLPLAGESNLIVPLGTWVLGEATRQMAVWTDAGYAGVRVAINLDAEQLASEGLLELVGQALSANGLAPEQLEIEITEHTATADVAVTAPVLEELHRLGVRLTLDDFGTGYSSLGMLLAHPFDTLKIDRDFVHHIFDGDKERALTEAIICLAHQTGMTVVAEGVETLEQLALLREFGADEIQGYYFSQPLPAEECQPFITEGVVPT